jgi:4-amino-4-deoxy-L-arabinose transferase-like glycosyltransferase
MTETSLDSRREPAAAPTTARDRPAVVWSALDLIVVAALALVVLLPGIWSIAPTNAVDRAAAARVDVVLAGPTLADRLLPGGLADPAPPLASWLQAGALWAYGPSDPVPSWVPRAPSAIAAVLAVIVTWAAALAASGRAAALIAGGLVATTMAAGLAARLQGPDALALLAVTLVGAAVVSAVAAPEGRPSAPRTIAFWLGLALVFLSGGWVAGVVALSLVLALVVSDPGAGRLRALDPARGPALLVLAISPVLAAAVVLAYRGGVAPSTALLGWFAPPDAGRWGPPGTHVVLAIGTLWPLSAFLPVLLATRPSPPGDPARRRVFTVLAAWILPAWVALEAVPVKRPLDVLALSPALALLVGIALSTSRFPTGRISARAGWVLLAATAVVLVFGLNAAFVLAAGHASPSGLVAGAGAIVVAFVATRLLVAGRARSAAPLVAAAAALVAAIAFVLLPEATGWLMAAWSP